MKEILNRLISVAMALLVLLSTTSWKVEKHYCMGYLVDVAVFSEVGTCGMDAGFVDHEDAQIQQQKSCCSDEVIIIDGQDDLRLSFDDFSEGRQSFSVAFTYSYLGLFQNLSELPMPHFYCPPSILVKDIQLLDEVFLI